MKNYFFTVVTAIAVLPMALGQIQGLDAYKKIRTYEEADANPGMKYYIKGYQEAGLAYSSYVYSDPDENGNTIWVVDGCEVTTEQGIEVYNELERVLHENDLKIGDFDPEQTAEEFDQSDVTAAINAEADPIFAVYRIGAGFIFFTAEPHEVKMIIHDRQYSRRIF
jgi:hypothetical protein